MKSVVLLLSWHLIVLSSVNISNAQDIEFNTDGLYHAEFFDYVFRGHFENIEIKREDIEFRMIFEQYLRAYGGQCPDFLPPDKVMIMEQECDVYEVKYNVYGVETDRYCIKWKWVPSGLYARPELYNAKLKLESTINPDVIRNTMKLLTDPNAIGNSVDLAHKAKGLQMDLGHIFARNTCNSKALRQFEKNLRLFALNQPGIRMKGASKYTTMKKTGGPTGVQDFNKLLNDLVTDQAKTWMLNRYKSGSISNVSILNKDASGKPSIIKADYLFSGLTGEYKGWVKVTFNKGLPDGIYFWDFPNNRKTPGSSIVASYASGKYSK